MLGSRICSKSAASSSSVSFRDFGRLSRCDIVPLSLRLSVAWLTEYILAAARVLNFGSLRNA